jgi:hypothetical protein
MAENRDTRLRFEQWAKNPLCMANAVSAVHNVRMSEVAKREGVPPTFGQSPFAIARGQTFERALFRDQAKSLTAALLKSGVLTPERIGFQDFRLRQHGGPYRNLDDALAATVDFFRQVAKARTKRELEQLPAVLAGPVVRIPGGLMLPEAILVIDVLVIQVVGQRPLLIVGEIKTYPDRAGYTDTGELATARAQAGVYVHGIRVVLGELRLTDLITVSSTGFLVLTRPGFNQPSIRAGESLEYQARRAERGFEKLRAIAAEFGGSTDPDIVIPKIRSSPTSYCEGCLSFCDRAPICHAAALTHGDATILGDDVSHFLGSISLYRALELMDGTKPSNDAEKDLLMRIEDLRHEGSK